MKIALLGYGKMGHEIEKIAVANGHEIVCRRRSSDANDSLPHADVAIDFSVPNVARQNIELALRAGIPTISGTTGWLDQYHHVAELCEKLEGTFLYASNFSLGVNIFFELNKRLAVMMRKFPEYQASIEEIHHLQKLDKPSGTAISLAKDIIERSDYGSWALDDAKEMELPITALREENVAGTHKITYKSGNDLISINHEAFDRSGFASGAVMAAEWVQNKKGIFSMKDFLGLEEM